MVVGVVEARDGVSTGISAADRAQTIKVAVDPDTTPDQIVVPGHIFPLKAKKGGVLERAGHTEGSIDLVRLSGARSSAVICEIMNDDGTMARMPDLEKFSAKHDIPIALSGAKAPKIGACDTEHFPCKVGSVVVRIEDSPITSYPDFLG